MKMSVNEKERRKECGEWMRVKVEKKRK